MEGHLRNANSDSEEDSIIISNIYFSLGMSLLVKRTLATFSSVKISPFKIIFTLLVKKNSVVLVRKRTIPTERPQTAGEVSAYFS
jgi:hypothetical protein